MRRKKILVIIGTRPEVIKTAPVIYELQNKPWAEVKIVATEQHKELLEQMLNVFCLNPQIKLSLMKENQSLSELTSSAINKLNEIFQKEKPDLVLAQGDTTTVMATAVVSFYQKIPFGHIEAGLRSGDLFNPFPEEFNRIVADRVATFNFAPTDKAKLNLIREGVDPKTIYVTGNTVIDALFYTLENLIKEKSYRNNIGMNLDNQKLILITLHRRESFGEPLKEICEALKEVALMRKDIKIVYPVHPNPNVRKTVFDSLSNIQNILLLEPLDYVNFVGLLRESYFIITDSGGIQEEAPALGKPVLVVRDKTERIEAVEHGVVKVIGRKKETIVKEVLTLLNDEAEYKKIAKGFSPYGDGKASKRIVKIIENYFFNKK